MSAQLDPSAPVQTLQGVGARTAKRLERLRIANIGDLLFHLPARYQDRTRVFAIGSLRPGDEAVIEAEIALTEISQRARRSLLCLLQDGTGSLTLRFFHFSAALQTALARGVRVRCYGEVRQGPAGLEMIHPEFKLLDDTEPVPRDKHLTPVYPTTEGLYQQTLRVLMEQALTVLPLPDYLPRALLTRMALPSLQEAIVLLHRPPATIARADLMSEQHPARRRLAFEELLAHHLSLRRLRARIQSNQAPAVQTAGTLMRRFLTYLPFALTAAQQRVIAEITADLVQTRPMLRLVQGDVGSGKTVVAAASALQVVEAGRQVAIMAPTELLSEQHYRSFRDWLQPLGLEIAWLAGKLRGKARTAILDRIASGAAQVVVGTHALFQKDVIFSDLALVIIDEQHRFGVHQRLALRDKGQRDGYCPHQLIMTATPIPRTLAMSVYADLDTSLIDTLPPGRMPVKTVAVPSTRRPEVIERIRLACSQGRQAYWVCTLIEESDVLQCQAAAHTAALLTEALPDVCVGLIHGRLKPSEKEQIMEAFKAGTVGLLVATTVIEVGVDVPNASLMIIENAERLGLAQLHQLRGRVGRGCTESSCVLFYQGPLTDPARARLAVLRESNDGFEIARKDLDLRGPGEVLGTRQTGTLEWRIADLRRDEDLLPDVRRVAEQLLQKHPDNVDALISRWVGDGGRYGGV